MVSYATMAGTRRDATLALQGRRRGVRKEVQREVVETEGRGVESAKAGRGVILMTELEGLECLRISSKDAHVGVICKARGRW